MILSFIEVAGFRGFRNRTRVDLASGFTIISGPNGVGKSSLFDAVEYLLIGKLTKYGEDKAAGEAAEDYVWTVGDPAPQSCFVSLGFTDPAGTCFEVTRTRESGLSLKTDGLRKLLGIDDEGPDPGLELLSRTSIIRDELIPGMSLELPERERFQFVSTAIGSIAAEENVERARDILLSAEAIAASADREYSALREKLSEAIEQLGKAEEAAARSSDVSAALERLRNVLPTGESGDAGDLSAFRTSIVQKSELLEKLKKWRDYWSASLSRLGVERPDAIPGLLSVALARVQELAMERNAARQHLADAKKTLGEVRDANELAVAVVNIVRLGRKVGRVNGHCPLCDTKLGEEEFQTGMRAAAARLMEASSQAANADATVQEADELLGALDRQALEAEDVAKNLQQGGNALSVAEREIREAFRTTGFELETEVTVDAMTSAIGAASTEVAELERALRVVELAQTVSGAKDLEETISALRAQSDEAERRQARAARAVQRAKEIQKAITRTRNELLEERLTAISPLLAELYQRFRPHLDWRTIEYKLRGDVRRFLSLSVGESFNPQFMFSSGQRRVAGLAFLLSIYLSRAWSSWQSLLLDDPVQHIDDYRALNLTEVLSAIRRDGRQIICAVEDQQLGDLLARRLRSSFASPGARIRLDLDDTGNPTIVSWDAVKPFPSETITSLGQGVG